MNVLYVTPAFYPAMVYGGTTESAWGFARGLDAIGCRVQVLTTNANGAATLNVPDRVPLGRHSEVIYRRRWMREATAPSLLLDLARCGRDADVIVLNATFNFTTFPTIGAARRLGKRLVWAPRGAVLALGAVPPPKKTLWLRTMRALLPHNTIAHCTSQEEANALDAWFPALPTFVVPNGVRLPECSATHVDSAELHVVSISRLHPIKGIDRLIRALAMLAGPWRCTIAGDGPLPYADTLRALVRSLGLMDRITFAGHLTREECDRLLSTADVYVCASTSENFGQSIAEALAAGVPVIASRGTPWAAVETHTCGLWVHDDPQSLHDALTRMRTLPRAAMGARGRSWMERNFSWEGVSRRWLREATCSKP